MTKDDIYIINQLIAALREIECIKNNKAIIAILNSIYTLINKKPDNTTNKED